MKKEFIPYEQALALKELGFDEKCLMIYYDGTSELRGIGHFLYSRDIKTPLYQQAFRWFRENHNLIPNIHSIYTDETHTEVEFWFWIGNHQEDLDEEVFYGIYEQAELECLKKLIKIANEQNSNSSRSL